MKQLGTDKIKWSPAVCTYQAGVGCVVSELEPEKND